MEPSNIFKKQTVPQGFAVMFEYDLATNTLAALILVTVARKVECDEQDAHKKHKIGTMVNSDLRNGFVSIPVLFLTH